MKDFFSEEWPALMGYPLRSSHDPQSAMGHELFATRQVEPGQGIDGEDRDLIVEGVFLVARVNHPEMFETKVLNCDVHGSAAARRVGVFELKPIMFACDPNQQIELGATMGRPEVHIAASQRSNDLLQREALPRRTKLRVRLEIADRSQLKKSMQESAVTDIDFGSLDLALADIFKPGRQDSDHVRACENVEVVSSGVLRGAERPCKLRRVPNLPVVVGDHGPKPSQSFGRNRNAELRNITLEKSSDKVVAPGHACSVVSCKERRRKSTAQPKLIRLLRADFFEIETGKVNESYAASQRFRHALYQIGRSRPKNKKSDRVLGPIHQNSQQLEKIGRRWISSMIAKPVSVSSALMGADSRRISIGFSRSK
jgi:hypothetical protein